MEEKKQQQEKKTRFLKRIGELTLSEGVNVDDVIFFRGKHHIEIEKNDDNSYTLYAKS